MRALLRVLPKRILVCISLQSPTFKVKWVPTSRPTIRSLRSRRSALLPRSKFARNVRLLVLSLASTVLSVVFAIAFIISALVALSVLFNRDAFAEIRTFINDHSREEVERIICMIIPIVAGCLILCIVPISQRIPLRLQRVQKQHQFQPQAVSSFGCYSGFRNGIRDLE